jgi:hypothetical protein
MAEALAVAGVAIGAVSLSIQILDGIFKGSVQQASYE